MFAEPHELKNSKAVNPALYDLEVRSCCKVSHALAKMVLALEIGSRSVHPPSNGNINSTTKALQGLLRIRRTVVDAVRDSQLGMNVSRTSGTTSVWELWTPSSPWSDLVSLIDEIDKADIVPNHSSDKRSTGFVMRDARR